MGGFEPSVKGVRISYIVSAQGTFNFAGLLPTYDAVAYSNYRLGVARYFHPGELVTPLLRPGVK